MGSAFVWVVRLVYCVWCSALGALEGNIFLLVAAEPEASNRQLIRWALILHPPCFKTRTEFINTLELGTWVCTRDDFGLTPLFAYVRRSRVFDNHVLAFHLSSHPICEQLFMLPMHGKYADTSH